MMNFRPNGAATVIGSFPHEKAADACELVFESLGDIPAWPQLPRRGFHEDMNVQFSRRLPCLALNEADRKAGFDTSRDMAGELERFYTHVIEDDVDYFALDDDYAAGFGCFVQGVRDGRTAGALALKGETTGPLTLGLMTDLVDGKYALYKPDLFDAVVKNCVMNARWQVRTLKKFSERVIVFFDEPSLSIIGSGFYSVDRDQVVNSFREITDGIHREGGLAGTHCCGNADWDDLLDPATGLDIINFDATDEIIVDKFVNARNVISYLERGGCVAWGVIPTLKDKLEAATQDGVADNFREVVRRLAARGLTEDAVLSQSIVTPSCGTGTLAVDLAEKAMMLLKKLSGSLAGKK
jgi:methionine synthase II (cobalamin-independent)